VIDLCQVPFDGALRHSESVGDFLIAVSKCILDQKFHYLHLSFAEGALHALTAIKGRLRGREAFAASINSSLQMQLQRDTSQEK
jgi:hypothetical protein